MTEKEYSRIAYLTNKAVLETARKEGEIEGSYIFKNRCIKRGIALGLSIEMLARITDTSIEYVESII